MPREAAQQQHKLVRELTLPVVRGTRPGPAAAAAAGGPGAGACEEGSLRWPSAGMELAERSRPCCPPAPRGRARGAPGAVLARAPAPSQPFAVNTRISHPLSGLQEGTRPRAMSHPSTWSPRTVATWREV